MRLWLIFVKLVQFQIETREKHLFEKVISQIITCTSKMFPFHQKYYAFILTITCMMGVRIFSTTLYTGFFAPCYFHPFTPTNYFTPSRIRPEWYCLSTKTND